MKQRHHYWIFAEIPHANVFQLIFADTSGGVALGFCAPQCWNTDAKSGLAYHIL